MVNQDTNSLSETEANVCNATSLETKAGIS